MKFQRCDSAVKFVAQDRVRQLLTQHAMARRMALRLGFRKAWLSGKNGTLPWPKVGSFKACSALRILRARWLEATCFWAASKSWMSFGIILYHGCICFGCPNLELQNGVCLKAMICFEISVCVYDLQLLLKMNATSISKKEPGRSEWSHPSVEHFDGSLDWRSIQEIWRQMERHVNTECI